MLIYKKACDCFNRDLDPEKQIISRIYRLKHISNEKFVLQNEKIPFGLYRSGWRMKRDYPHYDFLHFF